jgi:YbbR domain-containing protein
MIMKKLSGIFSSKAFYIVFSVLVSLAIWMYVQISVNKIQTYTFSDIEVVRLNEEVLGDRGLLISSISPQTITLTIECPRTVAMKLSSANLSAVIDLAGVKTRGYNPISYQIVYPAGVDTNLIKTEFRSADRIYLYVDEMETRMLHVEATYSGGVAEGFLQDRMEYSPQEIKVSGPADVVTRISGARAVILRENLDSTYSDDVQFILLDDNGDELEQSQKDKLTFISDETIHVTIPIRVIKEIVLTVNLVYTSGATEQNTNYTIDPPTILIAGSAEDIRDYNSINLGSIDTAGRLELTNTYPFTIEVPNIFTNLSGETNALVLVETIGLEIRHFSVPNSNMHVINEPAGLATEIRTQSIDVRIRGKAEDMMNLTESNIRIVTDLTDAGLGTQRILSRVYVDGLNVDIGAVGAYYVTVSIAKEIPPEVIIENP